MPERKKRPVRRTSSATRGSRGKETEAKTRNAKVDDGTKAKKNRLKQIALAIDERTVEIELRANEMTDLRAEAQVLMKDMKLETFDVPRVGEHKYVATMGRGSSSIDIAKFKKAVGTDVFMASVSVTQKAAKDVLPTKIVDKITTAVKGVMGAPVYSFTLAGAKKKK